MHIRALKQALNHWVILKKSKKSKFNQKAWLKTNIHMNAKLRTEAKELFWKQFL